MGIRDFLDRLRRKKDKYKEFEENMRIQEEYYEKRKSANERELEKYKKEAYEKEVKEELDAWRKHRQNDIEFNHQILKTKNMFGNAQNEILKTKNMFKHGTAVNQPGGLFWK